jgi:hypothetical protein
MIEFLIAESNKKIPIAENDTHVNLIYKKIVIKQTEIRHNGKRQTKKEYGLATEVDKNKMKSSIRANYVHALDAALVH